MTMCSTRVVQRVTANAILMVFLVVVALPMFWFFQNVFTKPTDIVDQVIVSPEPGGVFPGSIVTVKFNVIRYRSCNLEISRVLEQDTPFRREIVVQVVVQSIDADDPPFKRESGYSVQVPIETEPGPYWLFSRVRYFCNGLDYLWPRIQRFPRMHLEIQP